MATERSEVELDVRGLACPEPVVRVKNTLSSEDVKSVKVLTNEPVTVENIKRLAGKMGYSFIAEQVPDTNEYEVVVTKSAMKGKVTLDGGVDVVVFVSSDKIGEGEDELGELLMRTFFKTLREMSKRPTSMIFMNSGVKLTTVNEETVSAIGELEETGVEIINCGTCLDYYDLRDELRVGRISNFYEISEILMSAGRVLSL